LSEGTEEIHENPVRIAGDTADIRNGHLPNTRPERYTKISLLDFSSDIENSYEYIE
jgi:hypothetical protein